jgi:hypothetical protein
MTGVARRPWKSYDRGCAQTVEKLLRDLGAACMAHHDAHVRNLKPRRIQCERSPIAAYDLMKDVASRRANRVRVMRLWR